MEKTGTLPYTDSKPVGAADFYFAINATFRFVLDKFGMQGLQQYWTELGQNYFSPVSKVWAAGGLEAVANYWKAFFAAEPGAEVEVLKEKDTVTLKVKVCPAIQHLRQNNREIVPCFCQHCYFVSEAIGKSAGISVRIEGGNGSCRQIFRHAEANLPPQDFSKIKEAA
jgi:hypothetical protein